MLVPRCPLVRGFTIYMTLLAGEFGIVYKGCLAGKYTDEIVAIKTLKGEQEYHSCSTLMPFMSIQN